MKKTAPIALAFALAACTAGADISRDCILTLLNSLAGESPRRCEEAARAVAEEAEAGKPLHQFVLALASTRPGAPPSARALPEETRKKYLNDNRLRIKNLALQKENPLAWYLLYLDGHDKSLLRRAADGDNVQALNELATEGFAEILRKEKRSEADVRRLRECFGRYNRAAAKNDGNALYNLGVCYLNGWGCRKDEAMALDSLRRAAALEQPKAVNLLGELLRDGRAGCTPDAEAAVRNFAQCAMLEYPKGLYNYAKALLSGQGAEKNPKRAAALMRKAALTGLVEAMDAYAEILSAGAGEGEEAEKNRHEAVAWWRHCAEDKKYPPSMDSLGRCFALGLGVPKDGRAAAVWYGRAAEAGHVPAMLHLAEMCEDGEGGMKKSHYNANWWRTRAAAAGGDRNARVWLASHERE